jgi:hypothetical protein
MEAVWNDPMMRKLSPVVTLALAASLCSAALAAQPSAGAFAGTTSLHSLNGFQDVVTFTVAKNGRTLRNFQFGTFGCMENTGTFPVGVDPYALAYSQGTVATVPVGAKGVIALKTKPSFAETDNIVTTAVIKASFTSGKTLAGTIAISQAENGGTCGPITMKFSAAPGTPTSLGLSGV